MKRFLLPLGVFAALVGVLFVGIQRAPEKTVIRSALLDRPAPELALPVLGETRIFDAAEWRGRWYAINVWGTWCPECVNEHQALLQIAAEGRVPLLGLNWKDDDTAALRWLSELGNPYAIVVADREGRVAIDYGVYGAPETFLVDDRGIIVHKHVGPLTREIWQRDFLARLPTGASVDRS